MGIARLIPIAKSENSGNRSSRFGYPIFAAPKKNSTFRVMPPIHIVRHISMKCQMKYPARATDPGICTFREELTCFVSVVMVFMLLFVILRIALGCCAVFRRMAHLVVLSLLEVAYSK